MEVRGPSSYHRRGRLPPLPAGATWSAKDHFVPEKQRLNQGHTLFARVKMPEWDHSYHRHHSYISVGPSCHISNTDAVVTSADDPGILIL